MNDQLTFKYKGQFHTQKKNPFFEIFVAGYMLRFYNLLKRVKAYELGIIFTSQFTEKKLRFKEYTSLAQCHRPLSSWGRNFIKLFFHPNLVYLIPMPCHNISSP